MSLPAIATKPLTPAQQTILAKLSDLPPLSPVLNAVLGSLTDENFSYNQLGTLVEQDAVLTGNVLRLVNSAAYGRRVEVMAISKAIALIGVNKLRNLVLTLSVASMWRNVKVSREWSLERFNSHSLATAMLADSMAQHLELEFPEGAFIGGLMHDLGKLLIVMASEADYLDILAHVKQTQCTMLDAERFVLDIDHAFLSAEALAIWRFPPLLQDAVRHHHSPMPGQLSAVVSIADECAHRLGFGMIPPPEKPSGTDLELCSAPLSTIGLDRVATRVLEDFRTEWEASRAIR